MPTKNHFFNSDNHADRRKVYLRSTSTIYKLLRVFLAILIVAIASMNLIFMWQQTKLKLVINVDVFSQLKNASLIDAGGRSQIYGEIYKSNGYLILHSNGGLNQMRAGVCNFVIYIAKFIDNINVLENPLVSNAASILSSPNPKVANSNSVNKVNLGKSLPSCKTPNFYLLTTPGHSTGPIRHIRDSVSINNGVQKISDMVTVARYLNLTLVVPSLDKTSFFKDQSDFEDIFDVDHFIQSLRGVVIVVKSLPEKLKGKPIHSLHPISWSGLTYYYQTVLPLAQEHKIIQFNKTDSRLANNGLPVELQKLRCYINYKAFKFTPRIEEVGNKLISKLRKLNKDNKFVALHLRYEEDMLAFTGCTKGCTKTETDYLTRKRYSIPWWKDKVINWSERRKRGECPLTPEETMLALKALNVSRDATIYIVAGTIYGGERRLASLKHEFPSIVDKETLLADELKNIREHVNQMAALDYLVALASDVFIPTYNGNMDKVVQGHRRYMNDLRESIDLDRKFLVRQLDFYERGDISWDQFANAVQIRHKDRRGRLLAKRFILPSFPKKEDNFYSNPYECIN